MKLLSEIGTGQSAYAAMPNGNGHKGRQTAELRPPSPLGAHWRRAGWAFIFLFAAAIMFSISLAQISAALATFCWAAQWRAEGKRPQLSPLFAPIIVFALLSLIAAIFSIDRFESLRDSKDLFHLFVYIVGFEFLRREPARIMPLLRVVTASGSAIALVGFFQAIQKGVTLSDRISGFNDMYMTYAGLLSLAFVAGLAVVAFDFRKWKDAWIPPALAIILCAIMLSLTRSAWIGAVAGAFVILALRKPTAVLVLPILAALALTIAPDSVRSRFTGMLDMGAGSNKERLYVWSAGLRIVADHPVFGVGQNSFPKVYPKYREKDVGEPNISHVHNNPLQIAVDRGLPCLLAWLVIWGIAYYQMGRGFWACGRMEGPVALGLAAGLGGITAFLAAGMFEYNFGDAEPQMLLLLMLAGGMASAGACLGKPFSAVLDKPAARA